MEYLAGPVLDDGRAGVGETGGNVSTFFRDYVMAVDRVEKRLRKVTAALDAAGVKYTVIGGNAVGSRYRSSPHSGLLEPWHDR